MDAGAEMREPSPSVRSVLAGGTAALAAAGVSTPRLEAEVLLATACRIGRTALYGRATQPVTPAVQQTFDAFLGRRLQREPLQYIVGRQEFWSLDFMVTPAVLIPRPETELLVELALALFPPLKKGDQDVGPAGHQADREPPSFSKRRGLGDEFDPRAPQRPLTICDLGSGSGCLAVVLARELPTADICAVDQSAAALAVARQNARRHGVERIRFVAGDLFAPIAETCFDLIVCNPPYIATRELDHLQPELAWEPRGALAGGADGLDLIRLVVAAAPAHLVRAGWLIMEIGADQGPAVLALAQAAQFRDVSVRDDYAGRPRVLLARR